MSKAWKLARTMARHGVKVIPVPPREKGCKLENWPALATTNSEQINAWSIAEPEGNYGAVCSPDTVVILDADNPGLRSQIERTTERQFPSTLSVKSSKGYHYYFRQTDKTRSIGNRKVADMFDLQSDRKYVVGPGSVHPSGVEYSIMNDTEIVPMPDWLAEHLDSWAQRVIDAKAEAKGYCTTGKGRVKSRPTLHEEFDPEDFFDWYAEQGAFIIDGHRSWNGKEVHITNECIIAERKHSGSWHTGFIVGDDTFGYHCESPDCNDPSIGDVLRKLNEMGYARYPEPIWEEQEFNGFAVEDADDELDAPEPKAVAPVLEFPTRVSAKSEDAVIEDATDEDEGELDEERQAKTPRDPHIRFAGYTETDDVNTGMLVKSAASYEMKELQWLWPQKLPKGHVSFFTGKPDCGKSLTLLDVVARVTTGANWPDGSINTHPPSRVLLAASEDDPADTLIPRLVAAGADLTKVDIIVGTMMEMKAKKGRKKRTNLNLKRDAKLLLKALQENPDIALLALDPITSFFGDADSNKDKEIRPIMEAITRVCNKSGITVVGLIHSNKRSDVDAVHKVSGAGALAAVVRAVWGFARDPEDKSRCRMAFVKGNLGKDKRGVEYHIEESMVPIQGKAVGVPRVVWGQVTAEDADDLLKAERDNKGKKDNRAAMALVLLQSLTLPMKAKDIYAKAEAQGISSDSMKRAKNELPIAVRKLHDGWWWYPMGDAYPHSTKEVTVPDEFIEMVA